MHKNHQIRGLDIAAAIGADLAAVGWLPVPDDLRRLLGAPWPAVRLRTDNAPLHALGEAYDLCIVSLSKFVNMRHQQSDYFAKRMDTWPASWVQYIVAVAAGDKAQTRVLAARLQLLDEACVYPDGVLYRKAAGMA
jgi:hypothetical protein